MRSLIVGLAVAATLGMAAPADADKADIVAGTASCVLMDEAYALGAKLDKGIRPDIRQVSVLFGTHGRTDVGRSTHEKLVKTYPACRADGVEGFYRVAFYRPTMRALGAAYMSLVFAGGGS
jgi:hypothetical protein